MSRLTRRDFARAASIAAGTVLLPRRAAARQPATETTAPPSLPARPPATAQTEVDARFAAILARWGARLTAQDRAVVATLCADLQGPLEALRAATLDVTDEPALLFHAARRKH